MQELLTYQYRMKILYKPELGRYGYYFIGIRTTAVFFFFCLHLMRPFRRLSKACDVITSKTHAIIHIHSKYFKYKKKYLCTKTPCWERQSSWNWHPVRCHYLTVEAVQSGLIYIRPCHQSWSYLIHNLVKMNIL